MSSRDDSANVPDWRQPELTRVRALAPAPLPVDVLLVVLMQSLSRACCSALATSRTGQGLRCFAAGKPGKAGKFGRGDDEFDPDYVSEDRKRLFEPDDFDALQYDKDVSTQAATPPSIQWIRDTDDAIDKELAMRQKEKEKALQGEKLEGEKPPIEPEGAISLIEDPPQLEDLNSNEYFKIMKPHVDKLPNLLGGRRPPVPTCDFDEVDRWGSADLDEAFWMNDADELIGEEDINEAMLDGKEDAGDVDSDLDFCLLSVDRRTKVTKSGRVMTLSCLAAGGNRNGACGFGIGRGHTMEDAQTKAFRKAARSLLVVPRLHEESLLHNVEGRQGQTKVLLHAVDPGRGIRCSKLIRCLMELFGIRDVTAKVIGNKNPYSVVQATFDALSRIKDHGSFRGIHGIKALSPHKRFPLYTARLPEGFHPIRTPQNVQKIIKELQIT